MTAPTPAPVPLWEWARLDQLHPGDKVQASNRSPVSDSWLTVITSAQTDRHGWVVMVAEISGRPYCTGVGDDNVRRQTTVARVVDDARREVAA